jgi:hypothetical protein
MRELKRLTSTLLLALLLAAPTFAGDIYIPGPPPNPPSATVSGSIDTLGEIQLPRSPINSATVAVLNLLQRLMLV